MYVKQRLRPACANAQSDQSLCYSLEYSLTVKLLTEHHLKDLSLKGSCLGSSESTVVKVHVVENHMSQLICRKNCADQYQLALNGQIMLIYTV